MVALHWLKNERSKLLTIEVLSAGSGADPSWASSSDRLMSTSTNVSALPGMTNDPRGDRFLVRDKRPLHSALH